MISPPPTRLHYEQGTLIAEDIVPADAGKLQELIWDERTRQWRARGDAYRDLILKAREHDLKLEDQARAYGELPCKLINPIKPRVHQEKALQEWIDTGRRGVVQLPTGAGKTILAVMAIYYTARPTLIIVPTIDLLNQWQEVLTNYFGREIGVLGGGSREILPITVSTYDSAILFIERIGNQFGLLVVDECHHLPAPHYRIIALAAIAPFRLGLSATVERADSKELEIFRLLGPLVYEGRINEMVADVLSPYDVVNVQVPLTSEERRAYTEQREIYTGFLRRHRINFSGRDGWMDFVRKAARMPGGKSAMRAYREQKRLAQAATAKLHELWRIFSEHRGERIIVFTDDNNLAYRIGCEYILPVITHKTKLKERRRFLDAFKDGELNILVTSKVLNEGVDVPEASIGVVVSGSGAVREHVQRLGRILRHRPGKRACLYEIVSAGTAELYVNKRRRNHDAYRG